MLEVLTASKNSAKQDGGVDGRHLRVPHSFACVQVSEVVEESSMSRQFLPQKAQASHSALSRFREGNITALLADAQCCQPKARGSNAAHHSSVIGTHVASVLHHPG